MLDSLSLLLKLLITIALAFLAVFGLTIPAEAITQQFQWSGAAGYSLQGTFSYDDKAIFNKISERGAGQTKQLKSLSVTFYTPDGKPIHTYHNVVDGIAIGNYFEFNFDPETKQAFGEIDLGGELSGETYLKGIVDAETTIVVENDGREQIIDRNSGSISVIQ
jgi:hypothetical protein